MEFEQIKNEILNGDWLRPGIQSGQRYHAIPGTCYGAGMGTDIEYSNYRVMKRKFPWLTDCAMEGVHELGIPEGLETVPEDIQEIARFFMDIRTIREKSILDPYYDYPDATNELLQQGWRELAQRYIQSLPEKVPEAGLYRPASPHSSVDEIWWDTGAAEWVRENLICLLGDYQEFSSFVNGEVFPGPEAHFETITGKFAVEDLFTDLAGDTGTALEHIMLFSCPDFAPAGIFGKHSSSPRHLILSVTKCQDRLVGVFKCKHCGYQLRRIETGREWLSADEMGDDLVMYSAESFREAFIPCQKTNGKK